MAKVHTEVLVIKMSQLIKDNDVEKTILVNEEIKKNLEVIVQELVGNNILIEIEEGN